MGCDTIATYGTLFWGSGEEERLSAVGACEARWRGCGGGIRRCGVGRKIEEVEKGTADGICELLHTDHVGREVADVVYGSYRHAEFFCQLSV